MLPLEIVLHVILVDSSPSHEARTPGPEANCDGFVQVTQKLPRMGRRTVADTKTVEGHAAALRASGVRFQTGLLIGSSDDTRTVIVHLAPTPPTEQTRTEASPMRFSLALTSGSSIV